MDKREKTGSITHLVKIVATEVFHDLMKRDEDIVGVRNLSKQLCEKVISSCHKAGDPWTKEEDHLLVDEMRAAIAQVAQNHQRSIGAIKARVAAKGLIL